MLILLLLTIALNFYLIVIIPKGFFPQQDTGVITGSVRGPQDASFPVMNNSILQLENVIKADPAVDERDCVYRRRRLIEWRLHLYCVEAAECAQGCARRTIINRLRPKLNRLPVASAFLQAAQDLRIGGRSSNAHVPIHHSVGQRGRIWRTGVPSCLPGCRSFPASRM